MWVGLKKWYFSIVLIVEWQHIGSYMVNENKHKMYDSNHRHDYDALNQSGNYLFPFTFPILLLLGYYLNLDRMKSILNGIFNIKYKDEVGWGPSSNWKGIIKLGIKPNESWDLIEELIAT